MFANIGAELKNARLAAGYSIEEVSRRLNIRRRYLIALEEGDSDALPEAVYTIGYLKMYAKYLRINSDNWQTAEEPSNSPIEIKINKSIKQYFIFFCALSLIAVVICYNMLASSI